jgi:DNA polymerase III subunit gamma/tau
VLAFAPAVPAATPHATQPPARSAVTRPAPQAAAPRPVPAAHSPALVVRTPDPPPWMDDAPPDDAAAPASGSAALRTTAAPAITVPAAPPATDDRLVPTPLGDRWAALVQSLSQRGMLAALVRELAWQAGLERIDETTQPPTWHLRVERDSLRTDALRDKLCHLLAAELGQPLQLMLQTQAPQDSPARRDAAERERRQRQAEAAIRSDPLVLDLMSQFKGARIVPGSIKPL